MGRVMGVAALAVFAAVGLTGCGSGSEPAPSRATIATRSGPVEIVVEIADTDAAREHGLMGRSQLDANAGMLFEFAGDVRAGFWMKDTLIPLSIGFFAADGRLLRILEMEPCAVDPCPVYDPRVAYRYALEVNRGAFARWHVAPGDRMTLESGG